MRFAQCTRQSHQLLWRARHELRTNHADYTPIAVGVDEHCRAHTVRGKEDTCLPELDDVVVRGRTTTPWRSHQRWPVRVGFRRYQPGEVFVLRLRLQHDDYKDAPEKPGMYCYR